MWPEVKREVQAPKPRAPSSPRESDHTKGCQLPVSQLVDGRVRTLAALDLVNFRYQRSPWPVHAESIDSMWHATGGRTEAMHLSESDWAKSCRSCPGVSTMSSPELHIFDGKDLP